jgi:hypothetical protein
MDTRVVPSVVGLGQGFRARAALAHNALKDVGATPAFRLPISGNPRVNTLTLQSPNLTPFGRRAAFPAPFGSAATSRQAAMLMAATPPSQPSRSVVVPSIPAQTSSSAQASTATEIGDVKNGPLAKAGPDLIAIYQAFGPSGSGHLTSSAGASIEVVGDSVGVQVRTSGDVNALVATLSNMGMQIRGTDPNTHIVAGLLPVAQLVTLAQLPDVTSITPISNPRHS